jgi:hypothetical protein
MPTERDVLAAYQQTGSKRKGAESLGIPRTTFRRMLKRALVSVTGITPNYTTANTDDLIERLVKKQEQKDRAIELSRSQRVVIKDDNPVVVAIFSDTHWGNNKTDYRALVADTQMVADCPYCYAITAGDYAENWIGKLRSILGDSLLLYDQDQILFTLEHQGQDVRFKVRHRDQYKSVLNPFHGAFRDIERGDYSWDVYISGHDHKATLFGDFIHHDRPKKVVRLGTYKMDDRYGKSIGFAKSYGTGSAALVIDGGKVQAFHSIETAIKHAAMLRGQELP